MRRAALLLGGVVVCALATACGGDDSEPAAGATGAGTWQRVEPGGKTRCARGGKYAFWFRRGDARRLVLFFQGGGGCFDETTCAEGSPWFDDSVDDGDHPRWAGGMLDVADARNPFADWSWVYIPSCTGDVHTGDARVRYGSIVVEQRGWQNAHAALTRAFREFPEAEQIVVAGCSAGSVGSAWHVADVLARYPNAQVTQLGDSLAFLFHRPIRLTGWGTNKHFPPFFRIGDRRWTMEEFLSRLTRAHPKITFARFNHSNDGEQMRFYEAVGGNPGEFGERLRAVERRLKRLSNYRSYLACGFGHCALPSDEFYSLRVDGVPLRDWVRDLASGKDVACPACRGS
jgi:pectinacetylesterase